MMAKAVKAAEAFKCFTQEQVDSITEAMTKAGPAGTTPQKPGLLVLSRNAMYCKL